MPAPQAPTPTALAAVPGVIGATADGATTPLSANLPGNAPAMISTPLSSTTAPVGDKQVGANMAPELVLAPSIVTESKTDAGEPSAITSLIQGMTAAGTSRATPELSAVLASPTPTPELGSDGFDDAVGARVGWLADQKIGHAHIRITPHDMGTIEVRLQIDGDRVHASFSSAHAEVRQALETSLGRLREMLGEQGLELAQADVGQQPGAQDQSGKHAQASDDGTHAGGTDNPALATHMNPLLLQRMGLLDAYA
jgi:flagellar hook-length control protein FliK